MSAPLASRRDDLNEANSSGRALMRELYASSSWNDSSINDAELDALKASRALSTLPMRVESESSGCFWTDSSSERMMKRL